MLGRRREDLKEALKETVAYEGGRSKMRGRRKEEREQEDLKEVGGRRQEITFYTPGLDPTRWQICC